MKNRIGKLFIIFLVLVIVVTAFASLTSSGKAMRARLQTTLGNPVYLPIVQNSWPNLFGITFITFNQDGVLNRVAEAGAVWTRRDIVWSEIEKNEGERNWNTDLEIGLKNVNNAGIQPIMILESIPDWALKEGFKDCGPVAADKFEALGNFAYDLVKRYSAAPYNVSYWEIWNEPDAWGTLGCWGDPSDTQYYGGYYYGQMLRAVYPRIKQADPRAQVLVGGLLLDCDPINPPANRSCVESRFLEGILKSGGGPYFDGVSFHAYDYYYGRGTYGNGNWHSSYDTTGPVSITKANYLRSLLSAYGYGKGEKYLLNTETAVFWGPNVMTPPCGAPASELESIEVTKVNYVVYSYAVAVAQGWKSNVWFSVFGVRCSGLLDADLSLKPSYLSYQFTQQKFAGAWFEREINEYQGVMGYEYRTPKGSLWVVWSMDGRAHTLNLPELPVEMNRMGEDGMAVTVPNSQSPTVNLSPWFIEFGK